MGLDLKFISTIQQKATQRRTQGRLGLVLKDISTIQQKANLIKRLMLGILRRLGLSQGLVLAKQRLNKTKQRLVMLGSLVPDNIQEIISQHQSLQQRKAKQSLTQASLTVQWLTPLARPPKVRVTRLRLLRKPPHKGAL